MILFVLMKVVIFGATGMLGSMLYHVLKDYGYRIVGYSSKTVDICNKNQLKDIFDSHKDADFIINCAAYTKVDDAEIEYEKANQLNALAVSYLAANSKRINATFIHFSTDYVFDGRAINAYKESDKCNPLSVYGKSKFEGEKNCILHTDDYYIFRVQWLFGLTGNHFVSTMKRLFKEKNELKVVDDQLGSPTFTYTLSSYILQFMQEKPKSGIYHCTDKGKTSWYEFCLKIADYEGYKGVIIPVSSEQFRRPAFRPLNGVLNCNKFDESVNINRTHWKKSLALYYNFKEKEFKQ